VSVPTKSYRTNETSLGVADQPRIQRRLVELQIEKALRNRAIDGVAVSFIDGTAYLEGQVASEKQRSLAEKAALSVSEVRNVHNRLDLQP
jgi:osmotically-inducible protein OsmY